MVVVAGARFPLGERTDFWMEWTIKETQNGLGAWGDVRDGGLWS